MGAQEKSSEWELKGQRNSFFTEDCNDGQASQRLSKLPYIESDYLTIDLFNINICLYIRCLDVLAILDNLFYDIIRCDVLP